MMMDGGTVVDPNITNEGLKDDIVKELRRLGTCDLCCLRYLLVKDAWVYRSEPTVVRKILMSKEEKEKGKEVAQEEDGPIAKVGKTVPCTVCLGLLENGVQDEFLNKIVEEIKQADLESLSYSPNLTLPVSIQIRAYSMWTHLCDKFPSVYESSVGMWKPEGISLKSAWKYICSDILKKRIDPNSEWITEGTLIVNIFLNYCDDRKECEPLLKIMPAKSRKISEVSRISADTVFSSMKGDTFRKHFTVPPAPPETSLGMNKIVCSHNSMFIAGRYCKYSRDVSQSPWLNPDGSRVRGQGSVQEFIADHVCPMFNCEAVRFSGSGREDTDVRMLGKGRPFSIEIVNPKKTLFTPEKILELKNKINSSTKLISVRDLQIVDKSDLVHLKEGEENKSKQYCALCRTPGKEVTPEMIHILNTTPMPIELRQKTPIRVLHRRNLDVRIRKILSMTAVPAKKSKEMFILKVQTEAGTYVKEFVHGDLGRTKPCVGDLIGCPTEILSLDVDAVELNWPPVIDD